MALWTRRRRSPKNGRKIDDVAVLLAGLVRPPSFLVESRRERSSKKWLFWKSVRLYRQNRMVIILLGALWFFTHLDAFKKRRIDAFIKRRLQLNIVRRSRIWKKD
jgi:hypothetical protein